MVDETMGNQQATEADIGWLAGIIDGEGRIGLSMQNKARSRTINFDLQIVNTDPGLIEKVVAVLRRMGVNPHIRERVHIRATWAKNTIVTVGKMAHIKRVFDRVLPHLTGAKRDKASLVLALIESRLTKTRADRYDEHELSLVATFRSRYVRNPAPQRLHAKHAELA